MATDRVSRPSALLATSRREWPLVVVVLGVTGLAWAALLAHHAHVASAAHSGHGSLGTAATRVAGWALMVLAMMLPPAIPLLRVTARLGASRRDRARLATVAAAAFTAVWVAAGAAYLVVDVVALALARHHVEHLAPLLAGGAAMLAGAYQFTPFKTACLTACRSPLAIVMTQWGRRGPLADVAAVGVRFGAVCVGCCWALMALTLVVGLPAMPLMVVMSLVMALERVAPRVRPLVPAVGVAAIALGVAILLGALPATWPVTATVGHHH